RRESRQQIEAGDPERVDLAVRAAGEHQVRVASADESGRLADRLGRGGAGRQAVEVGPFQAEVGAEMPWRRVQLLLGLVQRIEDGQPAALEAGRLHFLPVLQVMAGDLRDQVGEVLNALAGAEVNTKTSTVHPVI